PVLRAHLPIWQAELRQLATWWSNVARDPQGGFYGEVGLDNQPLASAPRGLIHNARILYFFSRLARHTLDAEHSACAHHAYEYLAAHFYDAAHGGYFGLLDAEGRPLDKHKHLYAQAFALYGLTTYYQLTGRAEVLAQALELFSRLETVAADSQWGGYWEGFAADWRWLEDGRLCETSPQAAKTANTHLHLLEAYTALAQASGETSVRQSLARLLKVFCVRLVDEPGGHLRLFLTRAWQDCSGQISFGHDIEASWLLQSALHAAGDETLLQRYAPLAQRLAEVSLNTAWSPRGGIRDGQSLTGGAYAEERTWWAQAEAFIGYLYAWQRSADSRFAERAIATWQFIYPQHRDERLGEWFWFAKDDVKPPLSAYQLSRNYKSGFWKCPYHNGRALIEACELMANIKTAPP
ncbi:MAG TPA: AGE family epimerase/isomerase, partial [Cellvibrionaceae bacterium]|nr:AGE family epimerase/isomerase [Cellvibrionaceae bacterium]